MAMIKVTQPLKSVVDTNESRNFIAREIDGKLIQPRIIDEEVFFNEKTNRYEIIDENTPPQDVYQGAELEKIQLANAIRAFQESAKPDKKGNPSNVKSKIIECHKWSDIERIMEEAQQGYAERRDSKMQKIVAVFFKKLGNSGAAFQNWMNLLPNGDYSSIICGASKLVITAAIRHSEISEAILTSLADIPLALDTAKDYLNANSRYLSLKLHQSFSKLCAAIFVAYKHMLLWLKDSSLKHALKAVLKQQCYGEEINKAITSVKEHSEEVRRSAQLCSYIMLGNVDQKLEKHIFQVEGMKLTVEGVKDGVDKISPFIKTIVGVQGKHGEAIDKIGHTSRVTLEMLTSFYHMLQDDVHSVLDPLREAQKKKLLQSQNGKKLTVRTLRKCLDYDIMSVQADITHALTHGRASNSEDQQRAKHFVNHPRLKEWLTAPSSEFLLANGNKNRNERLSPMTLSCGMLATSLKKFGGAIPLTFFCGMHCESSSKTSKSGAPSMMASLLSQLLAGYAWENDESGEACDFNAIFKKGGYSVHDIEEQSAEALCSFFRDLIAKLPRDQIVFVIIDGIRFYECSALDETMAVVEQLFELVQSGTTTAICKVLVTSAGRSRDVQRIIPSNATLTLKKSLDRDDKGFNVRRRVLQDGESFRQRGKDFRRISHPDEFDSESESESEGQSTRRRRVNHSAVDLDTDSETISTDSKKDSEEQSTGDSEQDLEKDLGEHTGTQPASLKDSDEDSD